MLTDLPFAKPSKRIVDRRALAAYARSHPRCEVQGCTDRPMPEPHHVISQKMGGDDEASNLLMLCRRHHVGPEGFHVIGRCTWFERFGNRLADDARRKVEMVIERS